MAHILVIEDEPDTAYLLRELFAFRGHVATTTSDGQMGLEMARRDRPDLILLDMRLPIVDGAGFLRQRAADEVLSKIPILVCTGNDGRRYEALALGANDCVLKPVEFQDLVSRAETLLTRKRAK